MTLIAITGHKGSGKDTAAAALVGYRNLKMAGTLKGMLAALYTLAGVPVTIIHEKIEGSLKEVPCDVLGGKTPREAMITLGTEWRDLIDRDLWSRIWFNQVCPLLQRGIPVVCTDIRFKHEADQIRALGGLIIRVERPGLEVDLSHKSESEMLEIEADVVIINNGTVEDLHERIAHVLQS